jgi:hypothetical protein
MAEEKKKEDVSKKSSDVDIPKVVPPSPSPAKGDVSKKSSDVDVPKVVPPTKSKDVMMVGALKSRN